MSDSSDGHDVSDLSFNESSRSLWFLVSRGFNLQPGRWKTEFRGCKMPARGNSRRNNIDQNNVLPCYCLIEYVSADGDFIKLETVNKTDSESQPAALITGRKELIGPRLISNNYIFNYSLCVCVCVCVFICVSVVRDVRHFLNSSLRVLKTRRGRRFNKIWIRGEPQWQDYWSFDSALLLWLFLKKEPEENFDTLKSGRI